MIQSCIILLLLAAYSVHANGTSTCSQKEITTSTCSHNESTTTTCSHNETITPTCSNKETTTPTCSHNETTTPACSHKESTTPICSNNETTTSTCSQKEITNSTCSCKETATSTCSQKETDISYLETAMDMYCQAKYKIPTCNDSSKIPAKKSLDCADVLQMGHKKNGVYEIWPVYRVTKPLYVYCDMETDGGGWTVIQRRGDFGSPKDFFYKDWKNYKDGFGEIEKDFWLGNDNIFALTNQKISSVRFDLKDWHQNTRYAHYDNFWIDDEDHDYTLQISGYKGNAGDSMTYHTNQTFATKDRNINLYTIGDCPNRYKGGWWYNKCYYVNINGFYLDEKDDSKEGICWTTWTGLGQSLSWTEMKIRPKHFRPPHS